ncbi:MAG: glycosyl transferase [Solirubrobacterales bacterium]|nr:glycosyl transferase [Solirubrobacterales bacterium]
MLALGARLVERGHEVVFETWKRWRGYAEGAGMRFLAAPEYPVFPTPERPVKPYEAVLLAAPRTRRALAETEPHAVLHDILTLAPALAGELEGLPVATLVPHVYPVAAPGLPPYALGARLPRTAWGRGLWRALARPLRIGVERGRAELNETRMRLGLEPLTRPHGGISAELALVATFPQLEYPRAWPPHARVIGPLLWEPPYHDVAPPPGEDPLVLVAPSTAQDPDHRLLRAALSGLGGERVRVLATTNRRPLGAAVDVPANARLVEWVSYSRTMPACDLVLTHAGHGTLVRALACGCPVLAVPHAGDMAENAARAAWARVGVRLPWRLLSPATLRLAVRHALSEPGLGARAAELAAWAAANDGATRAAGLVEEFALSRAR